MEMHRPIGIPSEAQLQELLTKLSERGKSLPDAYIKFLRENGGGQTVNESFTRRDPNGQEYEVFVNVFLGISPKLALDLYHNSVILSDRIPADLLPIGTDGVGNVICIGIAGERKNKIYMWWEDGQSDIGEKPSYKNVQEIAESFEELDAKLSY